MPMWLSRLERRLGKAEIGGSNPLMGSNYIKHINILNFSSILPKEDK